MRNVTVVGAGLAGSECAWQLAQRGIHVRLIEQKPRKRTAAQKIDLFAELVCSNSLRGAALHNAVGLLKEEMRRAGSLIMKCAALHRVPAGGAFAVDRTAFSGAVTEALSRHPLIEVASAEVLSIPKERPLVLATGPLTGDALAQDLRSAIGHTQLAYYDAIAPIVSADSINWERVFRASRYDIGGDDAYVNCPLSQTEYEHFVQALLAAEKVLPHDFEQIRYFEGCLPIEVMAERGAQTLAFGPMKPVGLIDPKTGKRPHAVVQLRAEDAAQSAFNMVGFQTRMKFPEQSRVFSLIPGLEHAEFLRYGSVHRNTFVNSPEVLNGDLSLKRLPEVYLAGQITGVEGYVESAACGLLVGLMLAAKINARPLAIPPKACALGALWSFLQTPRPDFQPSNILWSMFPTLDTKLRKRSRHEALGRRALELFDEWCPADAKVDNVGLAVAI